MKTITLLLTGLWVCRSLTAGIDTLKGTSDIEDGMIYGYEDCDGEALGEDCRRYNAGGVPFMAVGTRSLGPHRTLISFPGWDGTVPDSAKLLLFCLLEDDPVDRQVFVYPLTAPFIEGTEDVAYVGHYPDPDSGVTWNHAWLDVGDNDSLLWTSPGAEFSTDVACTTTITDSNQYFAFDDFNRLLTYWDSSGENYGCILLGDAAFPANSSRKILSSSEDDISRSPLLILYTTDSTAITELPRRRRLRPPNN